jgi:hypothetical protein
MARRNQYIKSKADFVLRRHHMTTTEGVVFENDKFTIMPEDNPYDNGRIISFSDSNFKFKKNLEPYTQKKLHNGNWISPENDGFSDFWTIDNCVSGISTSEYHIEPNPDCTTLKTFAYFGSAVELVNATIKDIILHYPGGIYYLGGKAEEVVVDDQTYYTMANDFEIDILATHCAEDDVENPMRILSASYSKYMDPTTKEPIAQPILVNIGDWCYNSIVAEVNVNGVSLFVYLDNDGNKQLLTVNNSHSEGEPLIVPTYDVFAEMYNKLDDFSKVLLNLTTNPLFTANFKTTYFANDGYKYRNEMYTFPSMQYNEWFTPRINGGSFNKYYDRLIRLAEYHDEYDSFNIWRMLTHESIKNLDWTTTSDNLDEGDFDSTRMKIMLTLYGRQYDDLKRYADNIKDITSVTYSNNGSIPNYFLTDVLENDGWDAFMVNPSNDNTVQTDVIYKYSTVCGHTSSDANIGFMKRLALNSNYIKSLKGTKRGIETMLNLFGLKNDQDNNGEPGTYQMHEYVAIATEFPSYDDIRFAIEQADDYEDNVYPYDTIPAALVQLTEDPVDAGSTNYFIPWFDNKNPKTGYMYFQMNGGWEKTGEKKINLDITALSSITSTSDFDLYNETVPYMKFLQDTKSLTALTSNQIDEGMVCYVHDISDLYGGYQGNDEDDEIIRETSGNCFSHYFILKNADLSTVIGFVRPTDSDGLYNCYGWRNIFTREYEGVLPEHEITCDGMKVLYLESLINYGIGNNPHVGFSHYDDGIEYLEYFNQLFKYRLDNNLFSRLAYGNAYVTEDSVKEIGFKIDYDLLVDDEKCHYFISDQERRNVIPNDDMVFGLGEDDDTNGIESPVLVTIGEADADDEPYNWSTADSFYSMLTVPEQEESATNFDEPASFSVVNVKNFNINFVTNGNQYLRDYIVNAVMPYLEHMIPSTTIFRYTFDGDQANAIPVDYGFGYGIPTHTATGDGVSLVPENETVLGEYDVENNMVSGMIQE